MSSESSLHLKNFFYRHGLVRTDHYILNDPDLSFQKIIRKLLIGESLISPTKVKKEPEPESKTHAAGMKLERPEDILRMDKGEILVKLEKGEGTLRIEKLGVKSEAEVKSESEDLKPAVVKTEPDDATDQSVVKPDSDAKSQEDEVQPKEEVQECKEVEPSEDKAASKAEKSSEVEELPKAASPETTPMNKDENPEEPMKGKADAHPEDLEKKTEKGDEMEVEGSDEKEAPKTDAVATEAPAVSTDPKESEEEEVPDKEEKSPPTPEKEEKTAGEEIPKEDNAEVPDVEMAEVEKDVKMEVENESSVLKEKEDESDVKSPKASEVPEKEADTPEAGSEEKKDEQQATEEASKEVEKTEEVKEEGPSDASTKETEGEKEPLKEATKPDESAESKKESTIDASSPKVESADNKETVEKEKPKPDNAEKIDKEIPGKVQSDLKALYPDLEVVHPLSRLPEIDTIVLDQPKAASSTQSVNQKPTFGSQSSNSNQQSFTQIQQSLQGMNSAQALQQLQAMEKLDASVSQLLAQSFQSQIKWPKDIAIEARLQHIVHCVEKGEWPVSRNFTVFQTSLAQLPVVLPPGVTATIPNSHNSGLDVDISYIETVSNDRRDGASTPYSDSSDVITITTDNGSLSSQYHSQFMRKRKRHIAIDVETERAKLHALLNSTNSSNQHGSSHMGYRNERDRFDRHDRQDHNERQYERQYERQQQLQQQKQLERQQLERRQYKELERHQLLERQQHLERAAQMLDKSDRRQATPQPKQSPMAWDDDVDERRATPAHQPPPAHQHGPRVISMPYDLGKFTMPNKPKSAPQPASSPAPSPSGSSGAIDLSGGPPKSKTPSEDSFGTGGEDEAQDFSMGKKRKSSKLDDMLGKLMQKKNVPVPSDEPVVGKEMKRRKLDEIVMGLSAAKEQQYPDPMLKRRSPTPMIPPGVTVTPASSASRTPTPTHSSSGSSNKPPFSITVTSVQHPSAASNQGSSRNASSSNTSSSSSMAKDAYSSFLAQAEQHNLLLKQVWLFVHLFVSVMYIFLSCVSS